MTLVNTDSGKGTPIVRRAEAMGTLQLIAVDLQQAESITQALREAAEMTDPQDDVGVETSFNQEAACLTVRISGLLAPVLRLIALKGPNDRPWIDDGAESTVEVVIAPVAKEKAIALNDNLLAAAKHRPQEGSALSIRNEHDETAQKLVVHLSGSLYATSYLLFLTHLHLTQSRT